VVGVLSGGNSAYILVYSPSSGLSVMRIKERDTASKLDLLLKMNYYSHGIMLAKQAHYSPEEVNNMVLMFADHKYKKCDWEGAITQYCHTIGYTEPSYVIRKFLDAQRIVNLTTYLEKLHTEDEGAHSTKVRRKKREIIT
jgi:vacuolar protein sorting-associated protein 11